MIHAVTGRERELGLRALNRALLDRQLLIERSTMSPAAAVAHLVGLQAQAVRPPHLALRARLRGFAPGDLDRLVADRSVVRLALMRSTLHVVTAADALPLRALLADLLRRVGHGQFGRQLAGVDLAELAEAGTALVQGQPLTFAELGQQLAARWPDRDPNALAQTVRNLVPLVQVPPHGLWDAAGPPRHTTAEQWLGRTLPEDVRVEDYVLRYLAAYGPASVRDMQKWSGLARLAGVVGRLADQLRTYRDPEGTLLFDLADQDPPDPDRDVPVRYLPDFDVVLLSHADRRRIIADEHRPRVFSSGGVIRATVLVDGFVQGRWRLERTGTAAALVVEPFGPLPRRARSALAEEGQGLLQLLAADCSTHDVRFDAGP
jgi:hypothetical protein